LLDLIDKTQMWVIASSQLHRVVKVSRCKLRGNFWHFWSLTQHIHGFIWLASMTSY